MNMRWMIVLALLVFAAGCDTQQKAADAAKTAAKDAKIAATAEKQKREAMSKPSDSARNPAKDETVKGDTEAKVVNADKAAPIEKTETSAKLVAKKVLADAIATAKSDNKALFVHFTADWWGWCHKLEEFLEANEELFEDDYNFVAIATDKMEGGNEVMEELKKDRDGGLPWMIILDGDGKELATSNNAEGKNVGCPAADWEIEHFVNMIEQSSDATDEEIAAINDAMQANGKKINDDLAARRKKAEEDKQKKADEDNKKKADEG